MQEAARITIHSRGAHLAVTVEHGRPLPIASLVIGKPPHEAAEVLPRLFNLCQSAQRTAARLALGLAPDDPGNSLRAEILRDHMLKLFLSWPHHLGLAPRPFPRPDAVAEALFGPSGTLPGSLATLERWLASGEGVAPVVQAIRESFLPGEAVADLTPVSADRALSLAPLENSPAVRHMGNALLADVEANFGRGPYWRAVARLVDADACISGTLPSPEVRAGVVLTPAARGIYAVSARVRDGRVAAFTRVTPTDHMLAPGGMLEKSVSSLPVAKRGLAPLVVDILDPCIPFDLIQIVAGDDRDA